VYGMKRSLILVISISLFILSPAKSISAENINCWFPPSWSSKVEKAEEISRALSSRSGLEISPRIAKSYPEILTAFSTEDKNLVYVGSFVQAIIKARGLGSALVQSVNGKELYCGVLVYPEGKDPEAILKNTPSKISFAIGASSGESTAKAATGGKAAIGTSSHHAALKAVAAGGAEAAVVKNWWWEINKGKFPGMTSYNIVGCSKNGNPDNVLTASKSFNKAEKEAIISAAMQSRNEFGAASMRLFHEDTLMFSLWLMKKGGIDPLKYDWYMGGKIY